MSKNYRNFSKNDDESKNELVKKLKAQIKKLQKHNDSLISENKTLVDAWSKTEGFLQEITNGVPLEDLLKFKKFPKKAVRTINKAPPDKDVAKQKKQEAIEYWQKWAKENLK